MNTAAAIRSAAATSLSIMMNQASEMAVALWAWWSFVRMAFLELIASRVGKARRARIAGEVGRISVPAHLVCHAQRACRVINIQ
jgi:hypothetical protein